MPKKRVRKGALSDPSRLPPLDADSDATIQVIIETPKGSRNKYAFDVEQKIFELSKVLPAGMAFPYDFGFIPSTKAEDGDPTDVLVLMDEPAFPGCLLKCRVVGVIEGVRAKRKKNNATIESLPSSRKITATRMCGISEIWGISSWMSWKNFL